VDFSQIWEETKVALIDAYGDLLDLAIGVVEAIVVIIVATFVARYLRRRVDRGLTRAGIDRNVVALTTNGVAIGAYVLAVAIVLALLGASWTAVITVLGASTVALSLALQDVLKNFVAGVYILLERPFAIGDHIRVREVEGTVEGIDIRTTALRGKGAERYLVPNATLFAEVLVNQTVAGKGQSTLLVTGIREPMSGVTNQVASALADATGTTGPVSVEVTGVTADGTEVAITVTHRIGESLSPDVIERLRDHFPDATIQLERT
jgi:hypothetical protein